MPIADLPVRATPSAATREKPIEKNTLTRGQVTRANIIVIYLCSFVFAAPQMTFNSFIGLICFVLYVRECLFFRTE